MLSSDPPEGETLATRTDVTRAIATLGMRTRSALQRVRSVGAVASSPRPVRVAGMVVGAGVGVGLLVVPLVQGFGRVGNGAAVVLFVGGAVGGFAAGPSIERRFIGDAVYRLRFAGLACAYAALALATALALGSAMTSVVPQAIAGALLGWCLRAVIETVAGVGDDVARGALARSVLPVALGVVAIRWGMPLLPSLSDYAAHRVWRATTITPSDARAFGFAGVALMLGGGAAVAGLAATGAAEVRRRAVQAAPTVRRGHPDAVLEAHALDVSYGSVQVLFGVSLHVAPGEAVALLGTNGAGKSTVLRAIAGLTAVGAGDVWFDGERVTGLRAERRAARGLALVPGGKGIFRDLTVDENLRMAGYGLPRKEYDAAVGRVATAFPALAHASTRPAGLLSGGEQQMLALSRAHVSRPKLLAIDELTLGLAPVVVGQLLAFVRTLRDAGVALVLVEQSVNVALEVCDRAYFLERGEVRFSGPTSELLRRDDLLRSVFLSGARANSTERAPTAARATRR